MTEHAVYPGAGLGAVKIENVVRAVALAQDG
jgi:hypothetical protein